MINEPKTRKQMECRNPFAWFDMDEQYILPSVEEDILICAPNWLGDSVMAMPAVQALKTRNSHCRITLLVREELLPLWIMHPEIDAFIPMKKSPWGAWTASREVRVGCFDRAFVLPHSFRTALVPFLGGIPRRTGLAGYLRGLLINHPIRPKGPPDCSHQAFEYMDILGLNGDEQLEPPKLFLPREAVAFCWHRLYASGWLYSRLPESGEQTMPIIGLIPGAARGASKQWPAEHFAAVGQELVRKMKCRILVFGSFRELSLCLHVVDAVGDAAMSLAGETSLPELAAMLTLCSAVVSNDSGGMHLAAAVGTPVVAIFGSTDPDRTGPLGKGHIVLQKEGAAKDRQIKRRAEEARENLKSIEPAVVLDSVMKLISRDQELP